LPLICSYIGVFRHFVFVPSVCFLTCNAAVEVSIILCLKGADISHIVCQTPATTNTDTFQTMYTVTLAGCISTSSILDNDTMVQLIVASCHFLRCLCRPATTCENLFD